MSWVETIHSALQSPGWSVAVILFGVLSGVASIASLGITVYVARTLRRQDRRFKRLALLPTYNERLKNCLKSLDNALKRNNEQRLRSEIARAKSILSQVREFGELDLRNEIDLQVEAIKKLSEVSSDDFNAQINAMVGRLNGVIESCIDLEIKIPWRHPDEG